MIISGNISRTPISLSVAEKLIEHIVFNCSFDSYDNGDICEVPSGTLLEGPNKQSLNESLFLKSLDCRLWDSHRHVRDNRLQLFNSDGEFPFLFSFYIFPVGDITSNEVRYISDVEPTSNGQIRNSYVILSSAGFFNIRFFSDTNSNQSINFSTSIDGIIANQWNSIVIGCDAVKEADSCSIFINGIQRFVSSFINGNYRGMNNNNGASFNTLIGARDNGVSRFVGFMEEISLYKIPYSVENTKQIAEYLHNNGLGRQYPFN